MIGHTMLALGSYRFAVATGGFEKLTRNRTWRWVSQDRIGRPPALQFVGPGEDKVNISGVIYPHFRGGLRQVDMMAAQANRAAPLSFMDGMGRWWGNFVVLSCQETRTTFMSDGAPRKMEFELELQRYA